MLKKAIKILLAFALVLQIISASMTVASANEGNDPTDYPEDVPNSELEEGNDSDDDEDEEEDEDEASETAEVELEDEDEDEDITTIPQASVDAMRDFIENNSAENPLIIPEGLTLSDFNEVMNALDWGEGITISSPMSGLGLDAGQVRGSIFLFYNQEISEDGVVTYDDRYVFLNIELFYELEDSDDSDDSDDQPTIPQASIDLMRAFVEDNSADNPFVIPAGLTFNEAMNELDWGEGIGVWTPMSGIGTGQTCGSIVFHLNMQTEDGKVTYDDEYGFWDICIYYEFEDQNPDEPYLPTIISQASIDAIRDFIANNSVDNPLIIPEGLTFNEAMNELDWGEGITVWTQMLEAEVGQMCGSIIWSLNEQVSESGETTYDDRYGFWDTCIYYDFEDLQNNKSPEGGLQSDRPVLPQTGSRVLNASLIGGGILVVTGVIIYLKNKNKK